MDDEGIGYLAFSMVILIASFSIIPSIGKGVTTIIALVIIIVGVGSDTGAQLRGFPFRVDGHRALLGITIQPAQGYRIVKQQNAIVKNVNGLYYATGYVTCKSLPLRLQAGGHPRRTRT